MVAKPPTLDAGTAVEEAVVVLQIHIREVLVESLGILLLLLLINGFVKGRKLLIVALAALAGILENLVKAGNAEWILLRPLVGTVMKTDDVVHLTAKLFQLDLRPECHGGLDLCVAGGERGERVDREKAGPDCVVALDGKAVTFPVLNDFRFALMNCDVVGHEVASKEINFTTVGLPVVVHRLHHDVPVLAAKGRYRVLQLPGAEAMQPKIIGSRSVDGVECQLEREVNVGNLNTHPSQGDVLEESADHGVFVPENPHDGPVRDGSQAID
ncbi:hypothetical protein PG984_011230 [Apiospora sp. TS-2023a]